MRTIQLGALTRLWDHIKLSLNDPQWGRKPDSATPPGGGAGGNGSGDGNKPGDADKPAEPPSNVRPIGSGGGGGGGSGGGKKPDGPPDLDELLKKVSDKFAGVFGGGKNNKGGVRRPGGGGNGPQMPSISPQIAASGVIIGTVLAAVVWLASGTYQVEEGKRGIVQRFGKYSETTNPGLQWRWPWPIETVEKIDLNRVRSVDIGFKGNQKSRDAKQAQMLTEDLNIIDITFSVQYALVDARAFMFNHRRPDEAVVQAAETAMREVVGKRKMDFLLNQGREEFAGAAQKLMQQLLDLYGTGITIGKLNLQTVAAPEAVNESFQDVVKAQQDRDRFINEGQAYANRVIPEARGKASRLLEEAAGYEASVLARAQGDAARFGSIVTEYNKAPAVTRERLYLDMMQSVLGNTSKVFIDQKQGQSLLYLPLDKLMATTREAAGAAALPEATKPQLPDPAAAVEAPGTRSNVRESTRNAREARN
ncbi:MAG: FtsH protease activity modulator HflK [Betaproteobacteria bacterium]|nr:MAG: FtsH protease activity modulator HflK [Betaproteobacteria bacterium]TAG47308.1 MAG: FtsH protease activity modulator HflK [Betaproteobacteria bacterium]